MKYINNAAIWKKQDKKGRTFLSFKAERDIAEGETFLLFANDKQGNESRPDFRSYQVIDDKQEKQESNDVSNEIPF